MTFEVGTWGTWEHTPHACARARERGWDLVPHVPTFPSRLKVLFCGGPRCPGLEDLAPGGRSSRKDSPMSSAPKLVRTPFQTSRAMDFFSEKELVTQTGHGIGEWPLVIVKELLDNAHDGCEDANIAPVINVAADACGITVSDNGPGLPEPTLKGALDFNVRVSDKEAYVSPCRGAQGNALKTLIPMPVVIDPNA